MSDMNICIHRASDVIGGNCIEIAVGSERILLDAGRPLDTPPRMATPIPSSLNLDAPVAGVLLSHAHGDHTGMMQNLPESWPIYCGGATETLLRLSTNMEKQDVKQTCHNWQSGKPLAIGPFTVTPYLIDHSAFDAYAVQVDVHGKTIIYSGDFRDHGRKGKLVNILMKKRPQNVDVLIMEGTNLSEDNATQKPTVTEKELEYDFVKLFKETKGRVFVSWSASSIDRLVTLFRACKRSGRVLVPDLYSMLILMKLKEYGSIPQPEWEGGHMRTVVTRRMKGLLERLGEPDIVEYLKSHNAASGAAVLAKAPHKWVAAWNGNMLIWTRGLLRCLRPIPKTNRPAAYLFLLLP